MIRKRKHADLVLPLTSFGDIAFLMIIFFMLVSNFMKSANVQLEPAASESIDKQETPKMQVVVDEDGTIWYDGNICQAVELKSMLQMRAETMRDDPVHVSIHKSHTRAVFMPVLEAVSEAGMKMILTGEPEE